MLNVTVVDYHLKEDHLDRLRIRYAPRWVFRAGMKPFATALLNILRALAEQAIQASLPRNVVSKRPL